MVLIERSVMFHDEDDIPDAFETVYMEYADGRSVYVAAGAGPELPIVVFYPGEPSLLPNATTEEPAK